MLLLVSALACRSLYLALADGSVSAMAQLRAAAFPAIALVCALAALRLCVRRLTEARRPQPATLFGRGGSLFGPAGFPAPIAGNRPDILSSICLEKIN